MMASAIIALIGGMSAASFGFAFTVHRKAHEPFAAFLAISLAICVALLTIMRLVEPMVQP